MRMTSLFAALAMVSASLAACQQIPLGPELDRAPSPFGESPHIDVTMADTHRTVAFARITHTTGADTAVIRADAIDSNRDFDATVTWHAFESGVAEFDARYDYWLVGINILSTADRSGYAVLRLPDGWVARPGSVTPADTMYVTCNMMGFYYPFTRAKAYEPPAIDDEPPPAVEDEVQEFLSTELEAETCGFDKAGDIYAVAPQMIIDAARADMPAAASSLENYAWMPVTIRIP